MMIYKLILALCRPYSFAQRARRKLARRHGLINPLPTTQDLIREYANGKTFADIGCMWGINGANSFFAESCGATRVIAVDVYPATDRFAADHSRLNSRVDFILGDINETDTLKRVGICNVVFCGGVLYHTPEPFLLLARLRSICDEVLILRSSLIPEMPGLRNAAIFYPMLEGAYRRLFNLRIGCQMAITVPYDPENGYGNWFWGLTPSCVESLLECAGFTILKKYVEPFHGSFICRVAERKFSPVSGVYVEPKHVPEHLTVTTP
jgi:hypothetical protein